MRWLVDENVRRDVGLFLQERGEDVSFVVPGSTDGAVLSRAKRERRVLLTCDKDFAHPLTHSPASSQGIVVLCVHPPRCETCIAALKQFFAKKQAVSGKIVILTRDRMEIR